MHIKLFLALVLYGICLPLQGAQQLIPLVALEKDLHALQGSKNSSLTANIQALNAIKTYADWEQFSPARQQELYNSLKKFKGSKIDYSKSILDNLELPSHLVPLRDALQAMQLRVAKSIKDAFCANIITDYEKMVKIPGLKTFPIQALTKRIEETIQRFNALLTGEEAQQGWEGKPLHSLSGQWRKDIYTIVDALFNGSEDECRTEWLTTIYHPIKAKISAAELKKAQGELQTFERRISIDYGIDTRLDLWAL